MKDFVEQAKKLRNEFSSLSKLNSSINEEFLKKYGPNSDESVEKFSSFKSGKIYFAVNTTKYKPEEKNSFVNRYPCFLFLSEERTQSGTICKVMDLTIIPSDYRAEILTKLTSTFGEIIQENIRNLQSSQMPLNLKGENLQKILKGTGYEFAIFGFKMENLQNIKIVDYADWIKIPFLSHASLEGLSLQKIYSEYKSKIKI
jgi:hypothetical protein